MRWKIGPNTNEICRTPNAHMLPSFYVCGRTLHENVKFWRFYRRQYFTGQDKLSYSLIEEHEEEYPESAYGWQRPCSGDSGAGHWMKEGGIGMRQVLIGVHTAAGIKCGRSSFEEKINNEDAMRWLKQHLFP